MNEEEKKLVRLYGITLERKIVYRYQGYKYEHLSDALSYAKIDAERKTRAADGRGQGTH